MSKDRKIMTNKVLRLRINSNITSDNFDSKLIKPNPGGYILDRINANEKIFEKYRDKNNLRRN